MTNIHVRTSPEVVKATGATYRELDYWTRQGYVNPQMVPGQGKVRRFDRSSATPGSGYRRRWLPSEVVIVRSMVRLVRAGLAPSVACRVARGDSEIGPGVTVLLAELESVES